MLHAVLPIAYDCSQWRESGLRLAISVPWDDDGYS